jgi:outer membrane protein assembly factor BamB
LLLAGLLPLLLTAVAGAENWPAWRGPRGDGTSAESGVPLEWSASKNVRWKTAIPGVGHSSPVVWGDRVFLTTCVETEPKRGQRRLLCLDARDGKVLWDRLVLTAPMEPKHSLNSYASATPATDGKQVWVAFLDFPAMRVYCFDVSGTRVWQRSPGELRSVHGFCSSPVLHKGLVILNGDQDARAYLVALDKATGKEVWRADRPNRTRSYCVPIFIKCPRRPGVMQMVLAGSKCVTGYDADTGKLLWIHDGPTEQYVASLVYHQGVLFLTTGFPERHLMGLDPGSSGDITGTRHVLWHHPHRVNGETGASYVPSPLAHGGLFYVVSDPGYLSCLEAKTGKRFYKKRLGRRHSASPLLLQEHLLLPDNDGNTWMVKTGRDFKLVRKNVLSESAFASPAASGGRLFLRGEKHLFCVGKE